MFLFIVAEINDNLKKKKVRAGCVFPSCLSSFCYNRDCNPEAGYYNSIIILNVNNKKKD